MLEVISVECIWKKADHNALTDLIYFNGNFYCCFRESNGHAGGEDGKIRILTSSDAEHWTSVALLSEPGIDLRDPMLSEMPDGKLMLSMGGSVYEHLKLITFTPQVAFSNDGKKWSTIRKIDLPGEWLWRVTWHDHIGYTASYSITDFSDLKQPWLLKLFTTSNGVDYSLLTQFDVSDRPNETTLRFQKDGTMIALVRRDGKGWIGSAKPPYENWRWFETKWRFGGPNFLILPSGEMWAGSRLVRWEKKILRKQTCLAKMSLESYEPLIIFPSGGDNSYPGMVFKDGILYFSYYSSHENKAKIYLAKVCISRE